MKELRFGDLASFVNFLQLEPMMFNKLLEYLAPRITIQDTNFRNAIKPLMKLTLTLRYFATGISDTLPWNSTSEFHRAKSA